MTDRDTTTRTRARAPGVVETPPNGGAQSSPQARLRAVPLLSDEAHEGWTQTRHRPAHAGSRLKWADVLKGPRLKGQPSSRTGKNPPYGMIGGIEETSASFEARSAPRSYPTASNTNGRSHARNGPSSISICRSPRRAQIGRASCRERV